MSFASKHNIGDNWGIDTTDFQYVACKEAYQKNGKDYVYPLRGIFINRKNNSPYGPSNVIITEDGDGGFFLNAPGNWVPMFEEILACPEDVEAIKEGRVGFTIKQFQSHGKLCHCPYWLDM